MIFGISLSLSVGCQKDPPSQRRRTLAPQSNKDTGLALSGFSKEQVQALLATFPQAEYRELNQKHGLYELYHVPHQLIPVAGSQLVSPNKFEKSNLPVPNNSDQSQGAEVPGWKPCRTPKVPFPISWKIQRPENSPDAKTYLAPQNLEILVPSEPQLKKAIYLVPPKFSGLIPRWIFEPILNENITALGEYRVHIAAQNEQDQCSVESVRFILTSNPPFSVAPEIPISSTFKFSHLEMIEAKNTRQISKGEGIKIAIVDTGINYNDPFLHQQILLNTNEQKGITEWDDDHNGVPDDVIGYDFVNSDPFPYDDNGHGTHISGLIGAKEFGVAPLAKLIAIKAASPFGADYATVAAGIYYAVERDANIINISFGGKLNDPTLERALNYAKERNILIVVAAGNGDPNNDLGYDIDSQPIYPASSSNENVLTVGAYDRFNSLSPYSNFGKNSVDLVAPGGFFGDLIESLAYENPVNEKIIGMMGTSMAAPLASAVAAQVWGENLSLSASEVKHILMSSVTPIADLEKITVSGGILNSNSALRKLKD